MPQPGFIVTSPSRRGKPSPLLADNIDPVTHDFVSLAATVDHIDAQVIVALVIVRASGASVMEDGNRIREVKKMSESAQDEIKGLVKEALSRLIANRDIRYKGTSFPVWEPESQTGTALVQWVNLRARDQTLRSQALQLGDS